MRNKKRIVLAIAIILLLSFMYTAHALDEVQISVMATPSELSEAGTVEMNFSISNYSPYELHNVAIYSPGSNGGVYDIGGDELIIPPSGSAYDIKIRIPVSDSMIGLPIDFIVAWSQGGELMSKNVSVTVNRTSDPVITVSRTASAQLVRSGDIITFEYMLLNQTKFDMTDVVLMDEQISGSPIFSNSLLQAGNSISIKHTYEASSGSVVSAPIVTYKVLGKEKVFSAVEPVTIISAFTSLTIDASAGESLPTGVTFAIEVKNAGNQAVRNITVYDETNMPVNSTPFSLAEGDSETLSYRIAQPQSGNGRDVRFSLSGTDSFGQEYKAETKEVYRVAPYIDDAKIITGVQSEVTSPWERESGKIGIKIVIQNASSIALNNVQVYEQTAGLVKTLPSLMQGENEIVLEFYVGSPRDLAFTIKAEDTTGTTRNIGDTAIHVAPAEEKSTPLPEQADAKEEKGNSLIAGLSSAMTRTLIIIGLIIAAAALILVFLNFSEKTRTNQYEREKEYKEEMDSIFDPIENNGKKRKKKMEKELFFEMDDDEYLSALRPGRISKDTKQREIAGPFDEIDLFNKDTANIADKNSMFDNKSLDHEQKMIMGPKIIGKKNTYVTEIPRKDKIRHVGK